MTEKKISVIVPAYNVENYIRRCLDSLVNQTYKELEIIVVNDGSTDRTGEIVREYKERFPEKVFLYDRKNGGQAEARNFGLTKATGEYIGFVDSDDFVSADMYELMYAEAEQHGCDLVTCGYYGCDDVTGEITPYQTGYRGAFHQSIYENPQILRVNSPYPWNKLYTRELLERSGFQFPNGMIFEDLCAVFPLFLDAKKVGRVHEKLYYYIKGRKGGTISTFNEKHGQIIDALQIMNRAYRDRGQFEKFYDTLLFFNIRHIFARFHEMKDYDNEAFKKEFTERAYALLDDTFPGWRESEELAAYQADTGERSQAEELGDILEGETATDQAEEKTDKKTDEKTAETAAAVAPKKRKRRAEVFDTLVAERDIEPNLVLIECHHGNDILGAGYYIWKILAEVGNPPAGENRFKIYLAAADAQKVKQFRKKYRDETGIPKRGIKEGDSRGWDFLDMTSERYLEVLATAGYVVTNRAFPGFYRKRKGQKFIFTDFMPSLLAQGKEVAYETRNMQGIQFSLAQADEILFPAELEEEFIPLLEQYNMDWVCRDKAVFVPIADFFRDFANPPESGCLSIAYVPSMRTFPGLKDSKYYLFLSDLRKKLIELDEQLEDGRKIYVCFPRLIRRRFKENIWKHIEFFPDDAEPSRILAGCQGIIGEYGEELYLMKALGKPVCRFVTNERDVAWSQGRHEDTAGFPTFHTIAEVAKWVNRMSAPEKTEKVRSEDVRDSYRKLFCERKRKKNRRQKRAVAYIPGVKSQKELDDFLQKYNLNKTLFFVEKEKMDEHMAAWLKMWEPQIRYVVIIRSLVVSRGESRQIKYRLTTKDKLREKRDKERYGA